MLAFFVGQVVMVRVFKEADYDGFGEYMYALTWVMALVPFAALGIQDAAVRFVPQYLSDGSLPALRGFFRFSFALSVLGAIVAGLIAAGVTWCLGDRLNEELAGAFLVAWLILPFANCAALYQSILRGVKQIGWALFPLDVLRPMITSLGFWLAVRQFGMAARPIQAMELALLAFVTAVALSFFLSKRFVVSHREATHCEYRIREWLHVSLHMMGISAVLLAMNRADTLLLGFWYDKEIVGIYLSASQIATTLSLGMNMSIMAAAPMIAEYHASGALDELQKTIRLSAKVTFLGAIAAMGAVIVLGRWILSIFHPSFVTGYPTLLILCFAQLCHVVAGPAGLLMTLTGHHRAATRIAAGGGTLCIALNLTLIPIWGPQGAAIAVAIAAFVWRTAEIVYVRTTVGINPTIFHFGEDKHRQAD